MVGIVGALVVSGAVVGASVTTTSGSGLFSLSPYELFEVQEATATRAIDAASICLNLSIEGQYNYPNKLAIRVVLTSLGVRVGGGG